MWKKNIKVIKCWRKIKENNIEQSCCYYESECRIVINKLIILRSNNIDFIIIVWTYSTKIDKFIAIDKRIITKKDLIRNYVLELNKEQDTIVNN